MKRYPFIILDTDIGYDPDDLFGILYMWKREMMPDLIITGDECDDFRRARFMSYVCKVLEVDIPVRAGAYLGGDDFLEGLPLDTACDDDILQNYENDISTMIAQLEGDQKILYICIQGCSNLANIFEKFGTELFTTFVMGGGVNHQRPGKPQWIEHNLKIDPVSFASVLSSGADLHYVMAQTTFLLPAMLPESDLCKQLFAQEHPVWHVLQEHLEMWVAAKGFGSKMHDPLTIAVALGDSFVEFNQSNLYLHENKLHDTLVQNSLVTLNPVWWSRSNSDREGFMRDFQRVLLSP